MLIPSTPGCFAPVNYCATSLANLGSPAMDNTELRRILLANPYSKHPALLAAMAQDADLQLFARELQQQQQELEDALQVPVPPMLAERLLQIPQQKQQ